MKRHIITLALALAAAPAFAEGDAAAGETQFARQCTTCHVVMNDAGEVIAGRNARTGPNLYNVVSRGIGMYPDFNYGDSIVALGETGATWTEESFAGYVMNPTEYLRTVLGDNRARGKMAFQVRDAQAAADIYAYLASLEGN